MSGLPVIALLTADDPSILPEFGPPQWGIFGQDGSPVLVSDSVGSVEIQREYSVSNYPQEQGGFESYNKVQIPYIAKVTLLSSLTRFELLSILEPAVASLQLVSVVMPELSYPSANLTQYGFRRTSQSGVSLIAVDVWCKEIRFNTSSTLSNNQQQTNGGTPRPVGQVNGGSNLAPSTGAGTGLGGSAASAGTGIGPSEASTQPALNTGSTNGAYPTQSGPVQPITPDQSFVAPLAPF